MPPGQPVNGRRGEAEVALVSLVSKWGADRHMISGSLFDPKALKRGAPARELPLRCTCLFVGRSLLGAQLGCGASLAAHAFTRALRAVGPRLCGRAPFLLTRLARRLFELWATTYRTLSACQEHWRARALRDLFRNQYLHRVLYWNFLVE